MAASKGSVAKSADLTASLGLTGSPTLTSISAYEHGATWVIEISTSAGTKFVKVNKGSAEIGGSADWNSGTKVL